MLTDGSGPGRVRVAFRAVVVAALLTAFLLACWFVFGPSREDRMPLQEYCISGPGQC